MHGPNGRRAATVLVAAAALAGVLSTGLSQAKAGDDVESLRRYDAALAARARSAALELYGLESALVRARDDLSRTHAALGAVSAERRAAVRQLRIARETLAIAERRLAERLRALYMQGEVDPMEVLLGSGSLDEAIDGVQGLEAVAEHDRATIARTKAARARLSELARRLTARRSELARLQAAAAARADLLEQTAAARRDYLANLAERRQLGARRIAALQRAASARTEAARQDVAARTSRVPAVVDSRSPSPSAPSLPAASSSAAGTAGLRTLTVEATGYALRGRTASGVPVGWGVVAVDPGVIPLGTRLTIPGYGDGVAADTGGAVQGARIDLWFPSVSQALGWGRRTVTITVH